MSAQPVVQTRIPAPTWPASSSPTGAPLPFTRLLRVEWSKGLETRAARWLLLVTALAVAAALCIPAFVVDIEQTTRSYLSIGAYGAALLLPLVLILGITSEWTQRSVLVTFAQEPRRGRVLAAKLLCGALLALAVSAFAVLLTLAATWLVGALTDRTVVADLAWGPVLGVVAFLLVNAAVGPAFAALLQNTAGAIVAVLVAPTVWSLVLTVPALQGPGRWLDLAQTTTPLLAWDWGASGASTGTELARLAVSAAVWVGLPLALGTVRWMRRDVG